MNLQQTIAATHGKTMTLLKTPVLHMAICLLAPLVAQAKVVMPQMFQDGMVVQRGMPISVWGQADKGETVAVAWRGKTWQTTADASGRWQVSLPQQKAGGPYAMTVNGQIINNVMVGDVWLCSGQSNMDVTVERVYPQYAADIDAYSNDNIRLFRVKQTLGSRHGMESDVPATQWLKGNKQEAWQYSALGYFLARRMYEKTGVAQGIICNSWGGTPIEAWLPLDTIKAHDAVGYRKYLLWQDDEMVEAYAKAAQRVNTTWQEVLNQSDPGMAEQWASPAYDDARWRRVGQYDNLVADHNYVGSLWLRQQVRIDARHAGKPARLLLGTLYDCDYTYMNGKQVGVTYYQYPPRRYSVPAGLLKAGDNTLTIRFVNKGGRPHFIKEKPYMLIFEDGDTVRLSEQWAVSEGVRMPNAPGGGESLQNLPSALFGPMVAPVAPYGLAGVVWYQGESNTGQPAGYGDKLRQLTGAWRSAFSQPDLPFTIVQLANFMQPSDMPQNSNWAQLREEQRRYVQSDERSRLAVAIDLGETVDIHPLRKKEVAERVGLAIDQMVRGKKVALQPECVKAEADGASMVLTFDQALEPGDIHEMEMCGRDGRFLNATATAAGNTVRVSAPGVSEPVRVRYAWKDNPLKANLRGRKSGLPVAPFEN